MILQALVAYYQRMAEEGGAEIAPEGFQKVAIPFIINLDRDGRFTGITDTRHGQGKSKTARQFMVPKAVKRTVAIAPNLLWDNPAYVLGQPKPDKKKDPAKLRERAAQQHDAFVSHIRDTFPDPDCDPGISATLRFLQQGNFAPILNDSLWPEIEASGSNLAFRLEGEQRLVCQHATVHQAIQGSTRADDSPIQPCLILGNPDHTSVLHAAIKGVRGAQSTGANIVSFNLPAFNSFGKEQGHNAPVGKKAEFAYTTALNHLLRRDSSQKIQVGDATTVFWAERQHPFETVFADLFGEPAKGEPEQDYKSLIALFRSPETGARADLDPNTKFYVLGLAPNAARIAVRFWWAGTVGEIAENIEQHFKDLEMIKGPKEQRKITLRSLLRCTALQEKDDNISPNLAGNTMKAILTGTPYPQTLLASAIRRCRAEQAVHYTRAALVKAVLTRETRYYERNQKEVDMSLDTGNTNPGYLLGRLFAVLEKIQEEASPGINATIRDRFYGAASGTPVTAFPHLMKLKNHHLSKLENRGRAINLEKQIGEIIDKLEARDSFPSHLSLPDQGRFAVGYYHQRQDFFTKKDKEEKSE